MLPNTPLSRLHSTTIMRVSLASTIYRNPPCRLGLVFASPASAFFLSIFAIAVDAGPSSPRTSAAGTPPTPPAISSALGRRRPQDEKSPEPLFPGYAGPDPQPSPYLPAQIGGIVGAYAVTLVIVAVLLLWLSGVRKRRIQAAEELNKLEEEEAEYPTFEQIIAQNQEESLPQQPSAPYPLTVDTSNHFYSSSQPQSPRNFSYPAYSPTRTEHSTNYIPSPVSTILAPGVDLSVDQSVVATDRHMAQQQLEDMYKLVMEQEAAKEAGVVLDPLHIPPPERQSQQQQNSASPNASTPTLTKKEKRGKPANLDLGLGHEKKESRTSSFLSALKSPRKKKVQGLSISSPIMTPMSGTFTRGPDVQEMSTIPPRQYAPAAPPPVPNSQYSHHMSNDSNGSIGHPPRRAATMPLTPEMSPQIPQSIDGRIGAHLMHAQPHRQQQEQMENHLQHQYRQQSVQSQRQLNPSTQYPNSSHSRNLSSATSEADPVSAASDKSTTPLMGLPTSPKPNVMRFPADSLRSLPSSPKPGSSFALPLSPKPGASFSRGHAPSAIRTGGALPLRAYEPALQSPNAIARTTKQTTFERAGPMSPNGQNTPFTGAAVPYSPYQPFSPVVPMTPSLVTREDRKRMRKFEPKTPTMEMVRKTDDLW